MDRMWSRLTEFAADIKLSHSVFALPFALLGMTMAAGSVDRLPTWITLLLIVACMVLARTVAMAMNRWADANFDARNPRTAFRAIPSGKLTRPFVLGVAVACSVAFVFATGGFWLLNDNALPLILSPLVLLWLILYSFTKRVTWLCHLFLGSALAISPIAAAIAVEPTFVGRPDVHYLAGMVLCWVAGFDVLYALQDVEVDRRDGLNSMPANLGIARALWASRLLHATCILLLVLLVVRSELLGPIFAVGVAAAAGLLVLEHWLVWRSPVNRIPIIFVTINGVISVLLGGLGIVEVVVGVTG